MDGGAGGGFTYRSTKYEGMRRHSLHLAEARFLVAHKLWLRPRQMSSGLGRKMSSEIYVFCQKTPKLGGPNKGFIISLTGIGTGGSVEEGAFVQGRGHEADPTRYRRPRRRLFVGLDTAERRGRRGSGRKECWKGLRRRKGVVADGSSSSQAWLK